MKNKRQKIKHLLKRAEDELSLYKKHKRFTNLSQSCEKTWIAFVLALELKSKKEIKKSVSIRKISDDSKKTELYLKARHLHVIHYKGSPAITDEETFFDIEDTIKQIRVWLK